MASSTGSRWKFTQGEIRAKLEELGYHNIPDQALQEFSNDLHGLISTESGQESLPDRDNYNSSETSWLNSPASTTTTTTSEQSIYGDNEPRHQERQPYGSLSHNIGKQGYDKEPAANPNHQGKQHHLVKGSTSLFIAPDKENLNDSTTSLRLAQKRKVLRKKDGKSRVFDESFTNISATDISDMEHRLHELPVKDETDIVSINSDHSAGTSSSQSWGKNRNVLPSFIRPRSCDSGALHVRKSDPVNRYHQFKQEWSSKKVPGEKMHKHLRWTTREQMLQYETFEKPQHRYTPNNYVAPTEKKRQALRWEVRSTLANI